VELLILATPVTTILNLIQQLPALLPNPCILMDLGSTKREIVHAMSALPQHIHSLGGHPICGREKLGLGNADATLYQGAPFVVTPTEATTVRARSAAEQVIAAIGAHLVEMTAEAHDRVLASTSHLPFLIASSLARSTPHEYESLIGPGFRSTSRLAGTPSHMMMGILESNRDNILNAVQAYRQSLSEVESALQNENYAELENLLGQAHMSYHSMTAS
jgi:prephenate dehydrogenase